MWFLSRRLGCVRRRERIFITVPHQPVGHGLGGQRRTDERRKAHKAGEHAATNTRAGNMMLRTGGIQPRFRNPSSPSKRCSFVQNGPGMQAKRMNTIAAGAMQPLCSCTWAQSA